MNNYTVKSKVTVLLFMILTSNISFAALIENGDFSMGFSGWNRDTDGFSGSTSDFSIVSERARLEVDYYFNAGDIFSSPQNQVFFANTLYTEMDTSVTAEQELLLTFEWLFAGESIGSNPANEYFLVGINDGYGNYYDADGNAGFLIDPTNEYSQGRFSAVLNHDTFANQSGWFLDFQLGVGFDFFSGLSDGYGSFLEIDNVALEQITTSVHEPGSLLLLLSTLLGLWLIKKDIQEKRFQLLI